jgi:hypothetical protein
MIFILLYVYIGIIGNSMGAIYQLGDYWEYNLEEHYDDLNMDGTFRLEVTGWENVADGGKVYETTVFTMTGSGTFSGSGSGFTMDGTWNSTGRSCRQISNDEPIEDVTEITMEGTITSWGSTFDYTSTVYNETTYDLIIDEKASTLSQGDLGRSESIVTYEQNAHFEAAGNTNDDSENGTFHHEKTYNCTRMETVTVIAGTFETYVVRVSYTDGSYLLDWQSEKTGAPVKEEKYNSEGELVASTELTAYRFGRKATEPEDNRILGTSNNLLGLCMIVIIITIIIILTLAFTLRGKKTPVAQSSQPDNGDGPKIIRINNLLNQGKNHHLFLHRYLFLMSQGSRLLLNQ